jgi:predicted anti-sigma-YlaC factor YlaD
MNCKLCSALFQEFLENSLSEELIVEVQEHIRTCSKCKVSFRTYTVTVTLSRKVDPPCCVSPETLDRLRKVIRKNFPKSRGAVV